MSASGEGMFFGKLLNSGAIPAPDLGRERYHHWLEADSGQCLLSVAAGKLQRSQSPAWREIGWGTPALTGAPFIVRSCCQRHNQDRVNIEGVQPPNSPDVLAFAWRLPVARWLWSLPVWFLISVPVAVAGVGILLVTMSLVRIADDLTAVLEAIMSPHENR
jgi:hypothetical protein